MTKPSAKPLTVKRCREFIESLRQQGISLRKIAIASKLSESSLERGIADKQGWTPGTCEKILALRSDPRRLHLVTPTPKNVTRNLPQEWRDKAWDIVQGKLRQGIPKQQICDGAGIVNSVLTKALNRGYFPDGSAWKIVAAYAPKWAQGRDMGGFQVPPLHWIEPGEQHESVGVWKICPRCMVKSYTYDAHCPHCIKRGIEVNLNVLPG